MKLISGVLICNIAFLPFFLCSDSALFIFMLFFFRKVGNFAHCASLLSKYDETSDISLRCAAKTEQRPRHRELRSL